MKKLLGELDASPSKRIYHSIIADYTPELSIYELIDNAIDNSKECSKLEICVDLDLSDNSITIKDNSGGISGKDLENIVSPGKSGNSGDENNIGIFGVGSKRGVISLAKKISIVTHSVNDNKTYKIEYDEDWVQDDNWKIPYYEVDNIELGTTIIELSQLRAIEIKELIDRLNKGLPDVYGLIIQNKKVVIKLNGKEINFITSFDSEWAFPKGFEPKEIKKIHKYKEGDVEVIIKTGLKIKGSTNEYGVTFFGNNRLICKYTKDEEVGYYKGGAGAPHPEMSIFHMLVYFNGPSKLIPWNSTKSGINYQSKIYKLIKDEIVENLVNFSKAAKYLSKKEGSWTKNIVPYNTGTIQKINGNNIDAGKSYKLPIGKIKKSYSEKILDDNNSIIEKKPWIRGLVEGMIAVDLILRTGLIQKNRIAFIVLDSNFEIGMKEYLVNEEKIGNSKFDEIKENRTKVIDELKKRRPDLIADINATNYYYLIRNNFIHQKASPMVTDLDLENYKILITRIINTMFGTVIH
ncbi:MAG: ATP-binding protein [Candidatus Gracilibacteria bacterium]|nr:ATP-binding protein [Candidatus Gracilibacteria bacterium]